MLEGGVAVSKSTWDDVAMIVALAARDIPQIYCGPSYPMPSYPLVAHRRRNAAQRAKRRAMANRK